MIADVGAVMWKEWRELLLVRGSVRSTLLTLILPLGIVSIFLPLQSGPMWVSSPLLLAAWAWLPLFLVVNVVADSFAETRARSKLGIAMAAMMPMIATTISSSMRVKPFCLFIRIALSLAIAMAGFLQSNGDAMSPPSLSR